MAEIFLSAAIQVLFEKLLSPDLTAFARREGLHTAVKKWTTMLTKIQAVLNDAEEKQITSPAVTIWLHEIQDLAYDVDDILDEFSTEALRCKLIMAKPQAKTSKVRNLLPTCSAFNSSAVMFNFKMESKIEEITARLQEIVTQKRDLELRENVGGTPYRTRGSRDTESSLVNKFYVRGRNEDKEKILRMMFGGAASDGKVRVIPIIGMVGVGKTTLAQIVYDDDGVKTMFQLRGWTHVSQEFDVIQVTKRILESFNLRTNDVNNLDSLQVTLKQHLLSRRFLLVLDDVWHENYEDWTKLCKPLETGAPGSIIIITTLNQAVAEIMGTTPPYRLKELSSNDILSIFTEHALVTYSHPNFKRTVEEIVKRCKGLPLVAKVLGGLLRNKVNIGEWKGVLNRTVWTSLEENCNIIPVLKLSYHHLPPRLKQCLAYCSILPKDYEFEEQELVQLWMAAGLVQQESEENQMEDVGGKYFQVLVSRSFFQPSSINKSRFVMHDLINDLAQWVAGETCFRLEDKWERKKQWKISKKARHSSYVGSRYDGLKKFEAFDEVECLRTFLPLMTPKESYLTNYVPLVLLPKLRYLRVLSLSGYCITELPNCIGDMKHLRYLDLSHTCIRSLPESTSTLYNLQTLILRDCSRLKKFPKKMRNLIHLCDLDITGANSIEEMPVGVGNLRSLRTLSNFIVGNNTGFRIRELMNLQCLRGTLCISRLENVIDARDAMEANLKDKQDLDVLTMAWSSIFTDSRNEGVEKEVLDMLKPNENLKELTIKCYAGMRFPTWIGHPSYSDVVFLRLEYCVKCTYLPPLGQLPSLKELCIERMNGVKCVGLEFYGVGWPKVFPSLETLRFDYMEEWEDWLPCGVDRQVEVFPCLRELSIKRCPKLLQKVPDHLPSLEKLTIHGCQRLAVPISRFRKLSELEIQECLEVVQSNTVALWYLKSVVLSNISNLLCLTEGFVQGLVGIKDLKIVDCRQNEAGLIRHLTSLHRLRIEGCAELVSLVAKEEEGEEQHQLVLPVTLESLELYSCDNLQELDLHNHSSLSDLTIRGCPRLVSFLKTGLPFWLRQLKIECCDALKSLPQEEIMHGRLEYLRIDNCDSLTSIATGQLPLTLKELKIVSCKNLQSLLEQEEGSTLSPFSYSSLLEYSRLEHLYISRCSSLTSLSSRDQLPATLKLVNVESCLKLESIAEKLHNNTSLECIEISDCESLKFLPEGLHNLNHLSRFLIRGCPRLVSFPNGGLPATNLRQIQIQNCEKLEALPDCMHNLFSLQDLAIEECPGIVSFPEEGFPTNLTSLCIRDLKICKPIFEWGLHRLISLRELNIEGGCPDLVSFPEEEKRMILPNSLISLSIGDFPQLEYLSSMGFQNLTSLECLFISNCPKLKSFPKEGLPPSLLQLRICSCPLLQHRCIKDQGRYGPKIVHIPCVTLDGRFIFDPED